jgi:CheY-like chemotaxis protein
MKIPEHLSVLYAEDNDDACQMVSILLNFADIEVTAAKTVAEAWRLAQLQHFDLYLLDSRFPVGSGLDLCRQLHKYSSHTPILFYSGNAYQTDKDKGMAAGANDYLTKPYIDDLAVTILAAIKMSKKVVVEIPNKAFLESKRIVDAEIYMNVYENLTQANGI